MEIMMQKKSGFIRLLPFLGEYRKYAFLSPLFVSCEVVCEILIPALIAQLLDKCLAGEQIADLKTLIIKLVVLCFCALVTGMLAGRFAALGGAGFAKNLRQKCFSRVQNYSFSNLDDISIPSIITRLTSDITMVQNVFMLIIRSMIRSPLMIICSIFMAIRINANLSFIFILGLPFLGICMFLISRKVTPLFMILMSKIDGLNSALQEVLVAIRIVKSFVREKFEKDKFYATVQDLKQSQIRAEKVIMLNEPLMCFFLEACVIGILFFGGKMILSHQLTPGELVCFITYIFNILMATGMVSMMLVAYFRTRVCAERIHEVLEKKSTLIDTPQSTVQMNDGSIIFSNVDFGYVADRKVLNDISFEIKSGETIGIIGQTGCGKSSLVMLIPRLYDIFSGSIQIGGHNIKDYSLNYLRNNVSMVLQNNTLFSGTIEENLRWGNLNASKEEIDHVCEVACVDEFVSKMPNGLQTQLGEGGVNLSGGQKQRLCIARALLKNPKIVIFDDSTSAVDNATDRKIRNELNKIDATKLIITQRVISVVNSDRILVLNNGKVDAFDTPENLMKNNAIYKDMYETQLGGVQ